MKVVYEISALGSGHAYPINRTGTFRVVESLARGLAASGECDLTFAVTDSVQVCNLCLEYLKGKSAFHNVPVLPPRSRFC
jgi:hypothetical protein